MRVLDILGHKQKKNYIPQGSHSGPAPQPVVSKREKPQLGEGGMCPDVPAQLGAMWRLWARASSIGRLAIRGWRERHRASGFCK